MTFKEPTTLAEVCDLLNQESEFTGINVTEQTEAAELKKVYRKLSIKYHPDRNKAPDAAEKFDIYTKAYKILSDDENRKLFRNRRMSFDGTKKESVLKTGGVKGEDINDLFDHFGAGSGKKKAQTFEQRRAAGTPSDTNAKLRVDFVSAATGVDKSIKMSDDRVVKFTVPEGSKDGDVLTVRGQGRESAGRRGDLKITLVVGDHEYFERDGNDVYLSVPVTLKEALLGADIDVPTVHGNATMSVGLSTDFNDVHCLKGKGIKGGDQYVHFKVVMPEAVSDELKQVLSTSEQKNPRAHMAPVR